MYILGLHVPGAHLVLGDQGDLAAGGHVLKSRGTEVIDGGVHQDGGFGVGNLDSDAFEGGVPGHANAARAEVEGAAAQRGTLGELEISPTAYFGSCASRVPVLFRALTT
ncbi:hypothetical protein [Corynebacterium auris]|uniref:hypothetical protein n=1 Tax=Corynebacterium auris TaxID=44750 RepID=UPI0025B2D35D|nr:hypothetical protein [Corynebacterium auris]